MSAAAIQVQVSTIVPCMQKMYKSSIGQLLHSVLLSWYCTHTCAHAQVTCDLYYHEMCTICVFVHWYVHTGHDGEVLSTCWNHSGQWLLTCSMDKTARVWSLGHKDPLLNINTVRHNMTAHTTKDSKVCQ